ncbi:hypothetical protein AB6E79_19885, partial [Vibrio lentus]
NPRVGSSNLSTPAIFKALAEMLEPFCFLNHTYAISKATDSPTYQNSACWESKPPTLLYTKPQQKCWGFLRLLLFEAMLE